MKTSILNVGYKLVKNNTATATQAPYLGMPVPVGSLAYDNILSAMLDNQTFMSKATAQYFLKALFEYAAETMAENVVRISTGTVSLYPAISGSFDSEDAAFDPLRNTLYVGASLSQDLRDAVAGIEPDRIGDVAASSVAISSEMDLDTETPKVINGTDDFRIAGVDLTVPDGADESLALYTKDLLTKVCDIVTSQTDGGQRITCHLPSTTAIAKGTYKIRLASHGLDPTNPLTVVTYNVTLAEAVVARQFVTLTDGKVWSSGSVSVAVGHPEAIQGWDAEAKTFPCDIYKDGTAWKSAQLLTYDEVAGVALANALGLTEPEEVVKLKIAINPAKTEFDQNPVEATLTFQT